MKGEASVLRRRVCAILLAAGLGLLSGCATAERPLAIGANHPANPSAPSGTPAPTGFSLLAPPVSESVPQPPAEENAPAHAHHHDS